MREGQYRYFPHRLRAVCVEIAPDLRKEWFHHANDCTL